MDEPKVVGSAGRSRHMKSLLKFVKDDMKKTALMREMAQDRFECRSTIHGKRVNCV